jgi:hypothetical protein
MWVNPRRRSTRRNPSKRSCRRRSSSATGGHAGEPELPQRAFEFDEIHEGSPVVRSVRARGPGSVPRQVKHNISNLRKVGRPNCKR